MHVVQINCAPVRWLLGRFFFLSHVDLVISRESGHVGGVEKYQSTMKDTDRLGNRYESAFYPWWRVSRMHRFVLACCTRCHGTKLPRVFLSTVQTVTWTPVVIGQSWRKYSTRWRSSNKEVGVHQQAEVIPRRTIPSILQRRTPSTWWDSKENVASMYIPKVSLQWNRSWVAMTD